MWYLALGQVEQFFSGSGVAPGTYVSQKAKDVYTRSDNIWGVILAGGMSSRMGCPKPFLEIGGRKIIDIILEKMKQFFTEIIIVTQRKEGFLRCECKVIEDIVKGCGPLGGIYTGLKEISGEGAFFVACDMPYLHNDLISRIIESGDLKNYECIVPKHPKGIEPLHAIYSIRILPKVETALSAGELSLRDLLAKCRCRYIHVGQGEISSFVNINRPSDLAGKGGCDES